MQRRLALFTLLPFLLLCATISQANAAPLSGTKSVGPTGDFASLTAAIAGVRTQTLGSVENLPRMHGHAAPLRVLPDAQDAPPLSTYSRP